MRMCANVPAQHAIQTALGGYQSINELIVPGGRFYEQAMLADTLGYHCIWEVEHHGLYEYSHSSAPEIFVPLAYHW